MDEVYICRRDGEDVVQEHEVATRACGLMPEQQSTAAARDRDAVVDATVVFSSPALPCTSAWKEDMAVVAVTASDFLFMIQ